MGEQENAGTPPGRDQAAVERARMLLLLASGLMVLTPLAYLGIWTFFAPRPEAASFSSQDAWQKAALVNEERWGALEPPLSPRDVLPEIVGSLWGGSSLDSKLIGVGPDRTRMEEELRAGFRDPPGAVTVLYTPFPGATGLFTLKVMDAEGREGLVGIRLLRKAGGDPPWEVESLLVIIPPYESAVR